MIDTTKPLDSHKWPETLRALSESDSEPTLPGIGLDLPEHCAECGMQLAEYAGPEGCGWLCLSCTGDEP